MRVSSDMQDERQGKMQSETQGDMQSVAQDEKFIKRAFALARNAVKSGNEPFGALLVKDGREIFSCENQIFTAHDPTFHAETGLIRAFCGQTGITDLREYVLYTSCEPCYMCSGAIVWAKVGRVVYSASNRDLGAVRGKDGTDCSGTVFANSTYKPQVTAGVMREEGVKILREYFAGKGKAVFADEGKR